MNGMASSSSSASASSTHDSARHAFNIKVLRRHDPTITHIVYSASFVVLYQYSEATAAWTKTGIEGPMFLYEKQQTSGRKGYGAFVLNRNGVENWAAAITAQDDLEVTEQFVIFRSAQQQEGRLDGSSDDEDEDEDESVIGIWVFEQDQRQVVGEQMTRLQALSEEQENAAPAAGTPAAPATASSLQQQQPQPQSISLDALFASASSSTASPAPIAAPQAEAKTTPAGPSLLDAIFQSQSQSQSSPKPPAPAPAPAPTSNGPFGIATANDTAPKGSAASTTDSAAAGLMAMLRLGGGGGSGATTGKEQRPQAQQETDATTEPPAPHQKSGQSSVKSNGTATTTVTAPSFQDTAKSLLLDGHAQSQQQKAAPSASPPMSKGDFVREILQLIHTDKDFVKGLYEGYLERTQGK